MPSLAELRKQRIVHYPDQPPPPPEILALHQAFPLLPGELNLLVGPPGVGKSSLALDLASRAARAAPYPPAPDHIPLHPAHAAINPSTCSPGEILYASAEYHNSSTHLTALGIPYELLLLPRPHEASITPATTPPMKSRIDVSELDKYDSTAPLLKFLEKSSFYNLRLLILDPIHAFLDSVSTSPSSIRKALLPLIDFAERSRCAILAINHLSKTRGTPRAPGDITNQIMGSLAISAYARSILFLTHDRDQPRRRLLFQVKNNHGPLAAPLAFTLQNRPAPEDHDPRNFLPPLLQWEQNPLIDHPLAECAAPDGDSEPDLLKKSQLELACDFLQEVLKDGPKPTQTLLKEAHSIPISNTTLHRARINLKIPCYPLQGKWYVSLPKHRPQEPKVAPK